jgi:hypothetical protein
VHQHLRQKRDLNHPSTASPAFSLSLPDLPQNTADFIAVRSIEEVAEARSPTPSLLYAKKHPTALVRPSFLQTNVAMTAVASDAPISGQNKLEKKPIKFSNLLLGAGLNMFEVTTLGQPLEVIKTTMAAHRGDGFGTALGRIWQRGGVMGCEFVPHYILDLGGSGLRALPLLW